LDGDDRLPLRWARDDGGGADAEIRALEVDGMELRSIDESAGRDIPDDGVILPAVPQPAHGFDGIGRVAMQGARRVVRQSEDRISRASRCGLCPFRRQDHRLPTGAAFARVIQRGDGGRDMKRLFVVDRDGGNEADAPCRRSNCRREQGRVEHRASRVSVGKSIIEGNEIEQTGLGRLRHFDPRVRVLYVGIALVRNAVHTKCNMKAIGRVHLALLDWRTGAPGGRGASGRTQLKPIWQRSTFARAPSRYDMTWT